MNAAQIKIAVDVVRAWLKPYGFKIVKETRCKKRKKRKAKPEQKPAKIPQYMREFR